MIIIRIRSHHIIIVVDLGCQRASSVLLSSCSVDLNMAPSTSAQPGQSPSLSHKRSSLSFPNTPPEPLSFLSMNNSQQQQQTRPSVGHRRAPSGQQQSTSGLSMLQNGNGSTHGNGNGSVTPGQQFEGGRSPPNSKSML